MKRPKLTLLVPLVLAAAVAQGQQAQTLAKPNLGGTWVFSARKSSLKMPPPSSMTLKIRQDDPQVRFDRTQTFGDQKFDWNLEAIADGKQEVVQNLPMHTANVKVYWEGSSLVLDQKITATDGTRVSDVVTYSLVDNGKLLQAVEHQTTEGEKGSLTNKWVYEKQQ